MTTGQKIIDLRKKMSWSQETLAEQLRVSRQSVSKWESDRAMPEIDKLIKLSRLFSVTVDYLVKEELAFDCPPVEDSAPAPIFEGRGIAVDENTALEFMEAARRNAFKLALGVALCITCPVCLMLLAGRVEENAAMGGGLVVLFAMVAVAVALFIAYEMDMKRFEYLSNNEIYISPGTEDLVRAAMEDYRPKHRFRFICGVVLCVVCAVPVFIGRRLGGEDEIMVWGVALVLITCALGVFLIVLDNGIYSCFEKLLQQGDYTVKEKRVLPLAKGYWGVVTAAYLLLSFTTFRWDKTWIIWVVAPVVYSVIKYFVKEYK